jgi:hypothetical protein
MREDAMMKTGRYLPTPKRGNSIGTFVQAGGRAGGRAGRQAGRHLKYLLEALLDVVLVD